MPDVTKKGGVRKLFPALCERFELVGKGPIGEPSGFGVVWKARDTWLDQQVAIKISKEDLSWEVTLSRLIDGQTVRVCEYCRGDEGWSACVMELLEAPWISLAERKREHQYQPNDFRHHLDCLEIGRGLLSALQCIHGQRYARQNRYVHADVKPANLFVRFSPADSSLNPFRLGSPERLIKVIDLGISVAAGTPNCYCTPAYDAPGVIEHPGSDLYSVAMTLLELLTGNYPGHAVLGHKVRIKKLVEQNSSGSAYLDDVTVEIINGCARAAKNRGITNAKVLEQMEQYLFGLDPVYVVIMGAVSELGAPGLKKSALSEYLFGPLSPWFGWTNYSARRIQLIEEMIRDMYQGGMLFRHGHCYWSR